MQCDRRGKLQTVEEIEALTTTASKLIYNISCLINKARTEDK